LIKNKKNKFFKGVCFYEMLRGRTPYEYPSTFSSLQVLTLGFFIPKKQCW